MPFCTRRSVLVNEVARRAFQGLDLVALQELGKARSALAIECEAGPRSSVDGESAETRDGHGDAAAEEFLEEELCDEEAAAGA